MERRIFWHTHGGDATDRAFVADAMAELVRRLGEALPGLRLKALALPPDFASGIIARLNVGHLEGAVAAAQDLRLEMPAGVLCHVSIYCPDRASAIVGAARGRLPHAEWGIAMSGTLALTYAVGNRQALWHETLHLLGAQDHYDLATFRTTCELATCVMQYAPDDRTVGSSPFVCRATAEIVRRACA